MAAYLSHSPYSPSSAAGPLTRLGCASPSGIESRHGESRAVPKHLEGGPEVLPAMMQLRILDYLV